MKAKLLSLLSKDEWIVYKKSIFYKEQVLSNYQLTETCLTYYKEYFGNEYKDRSIAVFNSNNDPVIALYAFTKDESYTHFGSPVIIIETPFALESTKQEAYHALILKLNEVLKENLFKELHFYDNPFLLAEYCSKIQNQLLELNAFINLEIETQEIKSNVRKSYKSLINWGEKNLHTILVDKNNPDYEQFVAFKHFHIQTSGKQTRSDASWELQFDAIKKGDSYLVLAYLNDNMVSGTLVVHAKRIAYYSVGVYDRSLMAKNIAVAHYNMFYAICHSKKLGLTEFDLGLIQTNNKNEKDLNIFKFKSGFSNLMRSKINHQVVIN